VGLAAASALVVLIASGVALSRIGGHGSGGGSGTTSSTGTTSASGPASGSAGASAAGSGAGQPAGPAESAAPAPGGTAGAANAGTANAGVAKSGAAAGRPAAARGTAAGPAQSPPGSGPGAGGSAGSGGSGGNAPPKPQGGEPAPTPLLAVSISAGQGATGGVVGVSLDGTPDVDVTVGTTPLVGNAPPSQGTGVGIGGRLFQPPPTAAALPG